MSLLSSDVLWRSRLRPGLLRLGWRVAGGVLLAAWTLALLAWLTLHWWILPRLDEWRPTIAAQAGRALGHPVQIGRIAVHSSGWVPAFVLHEVVLHDAQGREALRLPQVSAALSLPPLLAGQLRFAQLLVEDARLEVRRDVAGRWHVAGLDVAAGETALDGGLAADWVFEQPEVVIRGGQLRWVDERRAAPPLQLSDVLLVLRNEGRRHALRLEATPPADWGRRFTVLAQARSPLLSRGGRPGDWQRWKGSLYAELPQVAVDGLRQHLDLPVDLQQGEGAFRAWLDWDQGVPRALTLDAALRDVSVQLARDLPPLGLAALHGRFSGERDADGVSLGAERLVFRTAAGDDWAPSRLALRWQQTQVLSLSEPAVSHPVTGGEFRADRLDLATLAELGERLPVGEGVRQLLDRLNPEGTVSDLQARWSGALDAPRSWSARASVKGLAIAAAPAPEPGAIGRPGWRGADLEISAGETGGQAELTLADGALELPGVFEQATVPMQQLSARLLWRVGTAAAPPPAPASGAAARVLRLLGRGGAASAPVAAASAAGVAADAPPRIELQVLGARFENDDARGTLEARWHSGAGSGFGRGGRFPGVLAMNGTLASGRATAVARYLPLGIPADTRQWVQHAVQGGTLRDVGFRVQGDLWDFPFVHRQQGDFRIAGQLQDVTLAPVPSLPAGPGTPAFESPWPAFSGIHGELVFERDAMRFQNTRGRLWGVELGGVSGRIRELSPQALLEIDGQARGPLADLLRYVRSTPLAGWTGHALDAAEAAGTAELRLGLNIPLARAEDSVVRGSLQLAGNDLRLRPDLPPLANARGRIDISHKGVQLAGVRTQVAGGEAQVDGGSQPDGSLRLSATGTASAEGLRRLPELGAAVPQLARRLQGQAAYRLQLGVQRQRVDWQLASNLAGLAIDLPAPLRKPAELPMALRLSSAPADAGGVRRDWLRLELGPLQAAALVDSSAAEPRPLRSALAWDAPLPEPVPGGRAVLALPRLDLAPWQAWLDGAAPAAVPASGPAVAAGTSTSAGHAAADSAWLPQAVQLKTAELLVGGRRLTGLTLDLQRLAGAGAGAETGWRAQLQADQAAGQVEYREPRSATGAGRVKARLARLSLPPTEAASVADTVAGLLERAPARVPALDIEVEDFELRGRRLGRLAVEAFNHLPGGPAVDEAGARSEWRLQRLQLANPDARLDAHGRWIAAARPGARRHMALDFTLDVADGGNLLERLGFGRVLRGAKGVFKGQLGWDGSPLELDLPTLGGQMSVALEGGRFLQVEPGAARLLGVLSLQALPRRLMLDFRDVFQQGFAFDRAAGDLQVQRGEASTQNLRLAGLQALVLMAGRADIVRETQDLQVLVLPELNTASASLAYAAVNPAIGLGAFVGQWLLREPLRQASAREFRVTGAWDDPKVERVERGLLDPLPASAAPAPQAASSAASAAAPAAAGPAPATPAASAASRP